MKPSDIVWLYKNVCTGYRYDSPIYGDLTSLQQLDHFYTNYTGNYVKGIKMIPETSNYETE